MKRTRVLVAPLTALALTLAACGSDGGGDRSTAQRTIEVTMADNSYTPSEITVSKGEEITFAFSNDGTVEHEALIGSEADQREHGREMSGSDGMSGHSMDGDMEHGAMSETLTVEPGESASTTVTFDDAGTYLIGCHVPGHYEAGMKATITVE